MAVPFSRLCDNFAFNGLCTRDTGDKAIHPLRANDNLRARPPDRGAPRPCAAFGVVRFVSPVASGLLWLSVLLTTPPAGARELPAWEELHYSAKALWVTVDARLKLTAADRPDQWLLQTTSSAARNAERVEAWLEPDSLELLRRSRYSRGRKNRRLKNHRYDGDTIERERREPAGNAASNPADWPATGRQRLAVPDAADGAIVTDAHALLLLAADALPNGESGGRALEVLVHTDFNFYRVSLRAQAARELTLRGALKLGPRSLEGTRTVRPVRVEATAVEGNPDPPDFSVLGLSGEVDILIDEETGLPLALEGRAPRVGKTRLPLVGATMRGEAQ